MKKEIADQWVEALRSGKYEQITGRLKRDNGYCCLGILCEISNQGSFKAINGAFQYVHNKGSQSCGVTQEIQEWSGLKDGLGELDRSKYSSRDALFRFNDSGYEDSDDKTVFDTLTFDEIADVIQMCWEDL